MAGFDAEMQRALEADGLKLAQLTGEDHGPVFFVEEPTPLLSPDDFEVEKDGTTLHVMRFANGNALVVERGANGAPDVGTFKPYHNMEMSEAQRQMKADGWTLKTSKLMVVTERGSGYATATVSGVCSPDVTVEDVKKRFYHSYFGGRGAWVSDGRFGCTIHTD